jgi:hypothetical protein
MQRQDLRVLLGSAIAIVLFASPVLGQGAGSTASQLLHLQAGGRSAGLSGAVASLYGDAESLFYNPAGVATLSAAAAFSVQRHVEEINIGSLAGGSRIGPVVIAAGITYLDAGTIQVIRPAPGGQRGDETGQIARANESIARLGAALPLRDGRLHAGVALGYAAVNLAEESHSSSFLDLGAQFLPLPAVSVGVALRSLGGSMGGAPLPTEARIGASARTRRGESLGALVTADVVVGIGEETTGFATGVEAGLIPADPGALGAVVRLGYDAAGSAGIAPLHLGAGFTLRGISLDYALQSFEYFGLAHRIGVRWSRLR